MNIRTANALKTGEQAIIQEFTDTEIALKLLEMGCLPNEPIELVYVAPLGDPLCFRVSGYLLSMRKAEAATILIR